MSSNIYCNLFIKLLLPFTNDETKTEIKLNVTLFMSGEDQNPVQ